jgi:hypothetical protein
MAKNNAHMGCWGEIIFPNPAHHPPVPTAVPTAVAHQVARAFTLIPLERWYADSVLHVPYRVSHVVALIGPRPEIRYGERKGKIGVDRLKRRHFAIRPLP